MTPEVLAKCVGCTLTSAQQWAPFITAAMDEFAINTPTRQAAFLAQVGHESGGLKYTSEIWGPTPAQRRYEGRADLGNVKPGDGSLYRGHGLLQTTGRANHRRVRDRLRSRFGPSVPDFEADPGALSQRQWAAMSAADYWDERGCNKLADAEDFERLTLRINGGINGYPDRLRRWDAAKAALGI